MAKSYVTYTGDGATASYAVPFGYLDVDHVTVTLDGVATTAFTWATAGSITFDSAPAGGVAIKVYRTTPAEPLVVVNPKARIQSAHLNLLYTQLRYILEEAEDAIDLDHVTAAASATAALASELAALAAQAAAEAAQTASEAAQTGAETAQTAAETAAANAAAQLALVEAAGAEQIALTTAAGAAQVTLAQAAAAAAEAAQIAAEAAQVAAAASAAAAAADAVSTADDVTATAGYAAAAATSASNAADALAQTLAAYDNFDDRYLGAKAANPTVDNDGNPLVAGALYFNTTVGEMRVYTGSIWTAAYIASGGDFLPLTGGSLTGYLTLHDDPVNALHAATKQYVDGAVAGVDLSSRVAKTGDTMTGKLTLNKASGASEYAIDIDGGNFTNQYIGRFKTNNGSGGFRFTTYGGIGVFNFATFTGSRWGLGTTNGGGLTLDCAGDIGLSSTKSAFDFTANASASGAARSVVGIKASASVPYLTAYDASDTLKYSLNYDGSMLVGGSDTGLARDSAGVVKVTDGATGAGYLQLGAANLTMSLRIGEANTGFANYLGNGIEAIVGGTRAFRLRGGVLRMNSTYQVSWSSGDPTSSGEDVGLARDSAGVVKVTNGSTGTGKLLLGDYLYMGTAVADGHGLWLSSDAVHLTAGGFWMLGVRTNQHVLTRGTSQYAWVPSSNSFATPDAGLARDSAGVVKVTDGSTGTGKLKVASGGGDVTLAANIGDIHKAHRGISDADYTLVLDDMGKSILMYNTTADRTLNIPPTSTVAWPVGTRINVGNVSSTYKTVIAPGSGVTIASKDSKVNVNGNYAGATLEYLGSETWWLVGDLS